MKVLAFWVNGDLAPEDKKEIDGLGGTFYQVRFFSNGEMAACSSKYPKSDIFRKIEEYRSLFGPGRVWITPYDIVNEQIGDRVNYDLPEERK